MARADDDHLNLLTIFHYVFAGLMSFALLGQFFYLGFGVAIVSGAFNSSPGGPPPVEVGWVLIAIFSVAVLLTLVFIGCLIFAGRCLSRRRAHIFCVVMAALACMSMPFGTILGVFTLVVLFRPSVKEQFVNGRPPHVEEEDEDWAPREAPPERERPRPSSPADDRYYSH
jgi:hypothetical protein